MGKYKYLITNGCSLTQGLDCPSDKTYGKLLADSLGLEHINLASPGSGWYKVENSTTSFIHNNKNILDECFFILQKSTIDRGLDYNNIPLYRTDVWEKHNIKYTSMYDFSFMGVDDETKFDYPIVNQRYPLKYEREDIRFFLINLYGYNEIPSEEFKKSEKWAKLKFFPFHKHYANPVFPWKLGSELNIKPPQIEEQFDELMIYWGTRILSYHLFLKQMNVDHIIVDGYSPFVSYELKFRNYFDNDIEYKMLNKFWGSDNDNDDVMAYDFKKTTAGYLFDSIDDRYKVNDIVLWSLFQFKDTQTEWNIDGVHAGPKGMELISQVILKNLKEKHWF